MFTKTISAGLLGCLPNFHTGLSNGWFAWEPQTFLECHGPCVGTLFELVGSQPNPLTTPET